MWKKINVRVLLQCKRRRMIYSLLTQAPLPLAYCSSSTSIYKAKPSTYFYRFSSVKTCHFLSLSILLLAVYRVKLRLFLLTGFFGPILSPAIRAFCLKSHEVERMASSLQNQGKTNLLISWLSTSTSSLAAGDPKWWVRVTECRVKLEFRTRIRVASYWHGTMPKDAESMSKRLYHDNSFARHFMFHKFHPINTK